MRNLNGGRLRTDKAESAASVKGRLTSCSGMLSWLLGGIQRLPVRPLTLLLPLLVFGAACLAAPKHSVRIGISESLPFYGPQAMEAWGRYLQDRVGRDVQFIVRPSHNDIANLLVQGKLDFAWICPSHYTRHQQDFRLVSMPVFQKRPQYRLMLVAPAYSTPDIQSLQDLRDTVIVFAEPDTNFGSRLIIRALRQLGIEPENYFRRMIFTGDHAKVLYAVASGLAHSGAVINQAWEVFRQADPEAAARLRVIWQSRWRPLPPVVAGPDTDTELLQSFQLAMLGMADTRPGRKILAQLHFDRFIGGDPAVYEKEEQVAVEAADAVPSCPD
jgi:phosphonate transport system substrate-binding protein